MSLGLDVHVVTPVAAPPVVAVGWRSNLRRALYILLPAPRPTAEKTSGALPSMTPAVCYDLGLTDVLSSVTEAKGSHYRHHY